MKPVIIDILEFNRTLRRQIGKEYSWGEEVSIDEINDVTTRWDCSELLQVIFNKFGSKLPDGSQNQFNFCIPVDDHRVGDLGFSGTGPKGINHVFYLIDRATVIEARGKPYNQVILRPRFAWESWKGFQGWRRVPDVEFNWPDGRPVRDYSKLQLPG